jgi:hypothetical protein
MVGVRIVAALIEIGLVAGDLSAHVPATSTAGRRV